MSTTKLATFRIDEQLWEQFLTKAKASADTASAVLLRAVHHYLDSQAIAPAPITPSAIASISSQSDSSQSSESSHSVSDPSALSVPAIYLAIAPDNTILYIDRAHPSPHWTPPYQLRHTSARFEWLSSSDPTLLSALEDCLIDAFNPPLNFRPKQVTVTEQPRPRPDFPPEIGAKLQQLLTSGFSSVDILNALESLSQTQTAVKALPEIQTDRVILQDLQTLTQSMSALQQQVYDRLSAVEAKVKSSPTRPQPKKEPEPKFLKGTATLDSIPQHPENTRSLAQRWGITDKILTRQRQRYQDRPDGFFHYSLEKEQGKFGWIYDAENQLYYALTELPSDTSNAIASPTPNQPKTQTPVPPLAKAKPKALPSPHTAAQLGQRFLSPRTGKPISAKAIAQALKRHHQEPDLFAQYCRHRDPDGFAWQWNKTDKLFVCIG